MNISKNSLLDHFKLLQKSTREIDAEAILSVENFTVLIRQVEQYCRLFPQFMASFDGSSFYTSNLSDETNMFSGWLPYQNKRWPIASNKLLFKKLLLESQLPSPEFALAIDRPINNFLVKHARSSFGENINGPFKFNESIYKGLDHNQIYFEKFIPGAITKIWFWDATPVCMELDPMPYVVGDGSNSIATLIKHRMRQNRNNNPQKEHEQLIRSEFLLKYFGHTLNTVLKFKQKHIVEFRYGSDLTELGLRKQTDFKNKKNHFLLPILEQAGVVFHNSIPAEIRTNTLYTIDAIIDHEKKIWFLEMNSNPTVHPWAYPPMLAGIFPQKN